MNRSRTRIRPPTPAAAALTTTTVKRRRSCTNDALFASIFITVLLLFVCIYIYICIDAYNDQSAIISNYDAEMVQHRNDFSAQARAYEDGTLVMSRALRVCHNDILVVNNRYAMLLNRYYVITRMHLTTIDNMREAMREQDALATTSMREWSTTNDMMAGEDDLPAPRTV